MVMLVFFPNGLIQFFVIFLFLMPKITPTAGDSTLLDLFCAEATLRFVMSSSRWCRRGGWGRLGLGWMRGGLGTGALLVSLGEQ